MINCNPETVSTDYDTSDRLYFEPLTAEDVLEIIDTERANGTLHGVIVQFGGQTPLKLAEPLEKANVPILGTSPDAIDLAEDRDRFKQLLDKLGLKQPKNGIAYSVEQARLVAADLGYPIVIRPSYVLGGRAMEIVHDDAQLDDYLLGTLPELVPHDVKARYPNDKTGQINTVLGKSPLLIDRYLSTPSRSTSIACATARTPSSPASWSTSRRPASIPAIPPARCRRTSQAPRPSPSSSARPARWRWRSTSAG